VALYRNNETFHLEAQTWRENSLLAQSSSPC
jgi:hypothetical protein